MRTYKCPNCGAETTKPICEYCGSTVTPTPSQSEKDRNGSDTVYVLPWPKNYQTDEDIIVKCFTHLRNMKDAPVDVFSHITDVQVQRYYLPMKHFNGNLSTDWNCVQVFDRKRIVGYETKDGKRKPIYEYYEEYIPANGKGASSFNFVVSVATKDGLPKSLCQCLGTIPIDDNITDDALPLSPTLIDKRATIVDEDQQITDKDVTIESEKRIESVAYGASFRNLSGRLKDCNYTYQWNFGNANNKRLLVPAATVTYRFKGNEYTYAYIFDGKSNSEYPQETDTFLDDIKSKSKKFTKVGWLLFLLSIVLCITTVCVFGGYHYDIEQKVASIVISIVCVIFLGWKALSISQKYDTIEKHAAILSTIRRTEGLKKSFPQFANNEQVNKCKSNESDTIEKISKNNRGIKRQKNLLWGIILIQCIIIVISLFITSKSIQNKFYSFLYKEQLTEVVDTTSTNHVVETTSDVVQRESTPEPATETIEKELTPTERDTRYSQFINSSYSGGGNIAHIGYDLSIHFYADKKCVCYSEDGTDVGWSKQRAEGTYYIKGDKLFVNCSEASFEFEIMENGEKLFFDISESQAMPNYMTLTRNPAN